MSKTAGNCHKLIDSGKALADICAEIVEAGRVAVDTEFFWERTFYPELGIVQLAIDQNNAWLLDIPALSDQLAPLGRILADPEIEKIIHDAKQDLTILRLATGFYPKNIFDTRLAAGFVGPSASISLLDACREFTGEILTKEETRSNWLQRPLTEKQCQYALKDVIFLPRLRDEIISRADALGRRDWLVEEMKIYDIPENYDDPPIDEVYSKVKGCSRLSRSQLAVLRELAAWREKEARRRNRPRRHILPDEPLITLATRQPANVAKLKEDCGLSPRAVKRYGVQLLAVIEKSLQLSPENHPLSQRKSQNQKFSSQSRKILDLISGLCKNNFIDHALIANRKEVEKLLQTTDKKNCDIPLLQGWRHAYAGERILDILQSETP
ncbi:MAG: HRDC domain-containing protein [Deltaproteobacteria bacterium]|nr:HRDC domain-containing protein [Deltaproteobacteria bacterium]